nr:multicopper oxidase domain-containing protein [Natronococcus sp. AD5]
MKDGSPIPESARYEEDVINVAPAERYAIELEADADPGIYPAHCHKVHRVPTEDAYPSDMATAIVYEEAMVSEEFAELVDDTGYGG